MRGKLSNSGYSKGAGGGDDGPLVTVDSRDKMGQLIVRLGGGERAQKFSCNCCFAGAGCSHTHSLPHQPLGAALFWLEIGCT